MRTRSALFRRALEFELEDVAFREGLDEGDLREALRQHGLEEVSEMRLAVLEEDGSISIVPYRPASSSSEGSRGTFAG